MENESKLITTVKEHIIRIREKDVILDSDLARIFGEKTSRLNEQVKRNLSKFPKDFMFQLNKEEHKFLISQNATSKKGRGGRRTLPYAFTEHGVIQAANVLNSNLANSISVFVVRAFIEMREIIATQNEIISNKNKLIESGLKKTNKKENKDVKRINTFVRSIGPKLQEALKHVLDTVIDNKNGYTLRDEAKDILKESINSLKEKLKKTGLENEEIAARITKLLAEAENERAQARKLAAETDKIEFFNIVKKLRLVLEAQKLLISDGQESEEVTKLDSFIGILKDLSE